jgi:hypothetical protein
MCDTAMFNNHDMVRHLLPSSRDFELGKSTHIEFHIDIGGDHIDNFPFVPNLELRAPFRVSVITHTIRHIVGLMDE